MSEQTEHIFLTESAFKSLTKPDMATMLNKREAFAMAAMQGLLANPTDCKADDLLTGAVAYADALIAKLKEVQ